MMKEPRCYPGGKELYHDVREAWSVLIAFAVVLAAQMLITTLEQSPW